MASRNQDGSIWRSFADLAMGLMAVLALILLLLLIQGRKQTQSAEQARTELQQVATGFTQELEDILRASQRTMDLQDGVFRAIRRIMEREGCPISLADDGSMTLQQLEQSDLYELGQTTVTDAGKQALSRCGAAFRTVAYCLAPLELDEADGAPKALRRCGTTTADALKRRRARCEKHLRADLKRGQTRIELPPTLASDIEAIVLEGNTDKVRFRDAPRIVGAEGWSRRAHPEAHSFVANAALGSERARQALGVLVAAVANDPMAAQETDLCGAVPVLLARVRVESPSYGRYQAGPLDDAWRMTTPEGSFACLTAQGDHRAGACAAARNLKLRIRWRERALRRPFTQLRVRICTLIADPKRNFHRLIRMSGGDPAVLADKYDCATTAQESKP